MTPNRVGTHKLRTTDLGSSGRKSSRNHRRVLFPGLLTDSCLASFSIQCRPTCLGTMLPVVDSPPLRSISNQESASHTCPQGNLMEDTLTDCPLQDTLMEVVLQMRFPFPQVSRLCPITIETNQDRLPGKSSFEKCVEERT